MKLKIRKKMSSKLKARLKKKVRIKKKLRGNAERPRLCVFRSSNNLYASLVNDDEGKVISSVSSLNSDQKESGKDQARRVGQLVGDLAKKFGVKQVVFDRNGFLYHGRIKEFAEAARGAGLEF